ncbi:MAG: cytoplasmic protein [Syntrophobacteraceae bacterium]
MKKHQHNFVDEYEGMVAFGFSRDVDEKSLMYYLQKFAEDNMLRTIVPRLSDDEINEVFELLGGLMRKHLVDEEYHELFLKDKEHGREED